MSCEVLNIHLNEEQRHAYLDLYAELVLNKIAAIALATTSSSPYEEKKKKKQLIPLDPLMEVETCCNFFLDPLSKKPTTFLGFMELIKKEKNGFFLSTIYNDPTVEEAELIFQVLKSIQNEEYKLSHPILASIQFSLYKIPTGKTEDITKNAQIGKALTYLFYFSRNHNAKKYDEFSKIVKEDASHPAVVFFCLNILLTCLVRQKICPGFIQLAAFFTCMECQREEEKVRTEDSSLSFIYLHERPTLDLGSWLDAEVAKGKIEKMRISSSSSNSFQQEQRRLWDLFYSRLPSYEEIRNIVFQIFYILYCLSYYMVDVSDTKISDFLIYRCSRFTGYNIYRTDHSQYIVPHFGNVVLLSIVAKHVKEVQIEKLAVEDYLLGYTKIIPYLFNFFLSFVKNWNTYKNELSKTVTLSPYPYIFSIKEMQEKEAPVVLMLMESEKIEEMLENMKKWWEMRWESQQRELHPTGKKFETSDLEDFFQHFFSDYVKGELSMPQDGDADAEEDLLINEIYTIKKSKALKVPDFAKEILYAVHGKSMTESDVYKKYIVTENNGENLIVSAEVENLARALEDLNGKGPTLYLFEKLKTEYGNLLRELYIPEIISDRFEISASDLETRKKLRNYGISFLNYLSIPYEQQLQQQQQIHIHNRNAWKTIIKLKNLFIRYVYEYAYNTLKAEEKIVEFKRLLEKYLRVHTIKDIDKFLNTLIILHYLSREGGLLENIENEEEKKKEFQSESTTSIPIPIATPKTEAMKPEFSEPKEGKWEKKLQEFLNFISKMIGISSLTLKENIHFIESKFEVPKEERILIENLLRKLLINEKKYQENLFYSHNTQRGNSTNKINLYNLGNEFESEDQTKKLTKVSLQEKIRKKKYRLHQLESQMSQFTSSQERNPK